MDMSVNFLTAGFLRVPEKKKNRFRENRIGKSKTKTPYLSCKGHE